MNQLDESSKTKIAVVIVTKNRTKRLASCLASIIAQSQLPTEVIIVDNGQDNHMMSLVQNLSTRVYCSFQYLINKKDGVSESRNIGLSASSCGWVALIDDDCIAHKEWIESYRIAITKHRSAAAIMGHSQTIHKDNPYSFVYYLFNRIWKTRALKNDSVVDFSTLDTKNILYNKSFATKHSLCFRNKLSQAEDCDFGLQLQQAGGQAFYEAHACVYHCDPTNIVAYIYKLILNQISYYNVMRQWKIYNKEKSTKGNILRTVCKEIAASQMGVTNKLKGYALVFLTSIINFIVSFYIKRTICS